MSMSSNASRPVSPSSRILFTAIGAAAMSLFAIGSHATESPRQVTVHYDGVDLAQSGNAAQLYSRLRSAAKQVCEEPDGRQLRKVEMYRACYSKAMADAVATVDHANVTELFRSDKDLRLAQRAANSERRT